MKSGEVGTGWGKVLGLLVMAGAAALVAGYLLAPEELVNRGLPPARWEVAAALGFLAATGGLLALRGTVRPGLSQALRELATTQQIELADQTDALAKDATFDLFDTDAILAALPSAGLANAPVQAFAIRGSWTQDRRGLMQAGLVEIAVGGVLIAKFFVLGIFAVLSGLVAVQRARSGLVTNLLTPGSCRLGRELLSREGQVRWDRQAGDGILSLHEDGLFIGSNALQGMDPWHHLSAYAEWFQACIPWYAVKEGEYQRGVRGMRLSVTFMSTTGAVDVHFFTRRGDEELRLALEERIVAWRQRRPPVSPPVTGEMGGR